MNITEMIEKLSEIKEAEGDLQVYVRRPDDDDFAIEPIDLEAVIGIRYYRVNDAKPILIINTY